MDNQLALGLGVRRRHKDTVLDVTYVWVTRDAQGPMGAYYRSNVASDAPACDTLPLSLATLEQFSKELQVDCFDRFLAVLQDHFRHSNGYHELDLVLTGAVDIDQAVTSCEEAFFKLHLLSYRVVKPHGLCLDGVFGHLQNLAWTNYGPFLVKDLSHQRLRYMFAEVPLSVSHVDKFPYLVNYHVPSGVRIASGAQVRLGAYLGDGTTVMQAGFINFNAGTMGNAMIEGRVSAGVVVAEDSDIGGGASIMGTLSGGNSTVISIGSKCLLGANSGTGISLGDGCTIAAGLYVYAGKKVALYNAQQQPTNLDGDVVEEGDNVVNARELSGRDNLLFIQDSQSGRLICKPNMKTIELNTQLHVND